MDSDNQEILEVNNEEPKKRKKGRPKGSRTKWGEKPRQWQPKKWRPEYENMCQMYYVLGMPTQVIADRLNYTYQTVNNVVNSEQGKRFGEFVIQRIREKTTGTIDDRLARLADKALTNIEDVLGNEEVKRENPLGIFDRSMQVLQGKGLMRGANAEESLRKGGSTTINNNTQINNFIGDKETLQGLMQGLNLSLEAKKKYNESKLAKIAEAIDNVDG